MFLMTAGARLSLRLRSAAALVGALLASTTIARAQVPLETLHTFDGRADLGTTSNSIMQARDGDFYLTSARGGQYRQGAIFKMTASGVVKTLHSFAGGADGVTPFGPLVEATDGNFYGTTERGGPADLGTVFRMTPDGSVTVLHSFIGGDTDGANPRGGLIQAADGNLYGTTYYGGTAPARWGPIEWGTIFGMSVTGSVTLFRPLALGTDLGYPKNRLLQAADGNFYGTTQWTLLTMSASGAVSRLLWFDPATGGIYQDVPMIQAAGGSFYSGCGITYSGYPSPETTSACVIRRGMISTSVNGGPAVATTFHLLGPAYNGTVTAFIQGADQNFYGMTNAGGAFGHGALFRIDALPLVPDWPVLVPTTLHSFTSGTPDALIQAADGSFYGTTTSGDDKSDLASVFRMTPDGAIDVLYTFSAPVQGATPTALIQSRDGNFYGTSASGGHSGRGTTFKMTPTGTTTDLHVFSGGTTDGASPNLLVQAASGDFVGTTLNGGAYDKGTIFRMNGTGAVTLLYSFADVNASWSTSANPSSLIQGADGNFYGTTKEGGAGAGTAFRMTPDGAVTVLHAFALATEGGAPTSLIQGIDGNLYGTTVLMNCEVKIFRMSPAGAVTILYTEPAPNAHPWINGCQALPSVIVQANDGYLYGTAPYGKRLYRVSQGGQAAVVRIFSPSEAPLALLAKAADGNLYGAIQPSAFEVIAKVSTTGTVTPVSYPYGPKSYPDPTVQLIEATDGNLYGIRNAFRALEGTQGGLAFRLVPRPAPTGLTVRSAGSGRAQLAWRPVSDATGYRIWRRSPSGQQTVIATNVTATTFVDSTVTNAQRYYYVVTAMTPFGESMASSEVSVTPGLAAMGDFDGDGKADISVVRPSTGTWYSSGLSAPITFGNASDVPVPGDYDGDGKTDVAVFRPSNGTWYIWLSQTQTGLSLQFGNASDMPVPADYDGDGKADVAVFRPSTGTWYAWLSQTQTGSALQFGSAGDVPVPADFDGDGKADVAVFRPATGTWYVWLSSTHTGVSAVFGAWGDIPVNADYDGDGKTDFAVYRPSNGTWYIWQSSTSTGVSTVFGNSADVPVPGDYDGDGRMDIAVFRPSTATWYVWLSSTQTGLTATYGGGSDIPILARQ
jgi:uncharacterized repeat protein (TIGR03803 family)